VQSRPKIKRVALRGQARYRGRVTDDARLVERRRRALARIRRRRLGFWRSLGRSNRLFPRKLVVTREGKWIIGIALLLGAAAVNTGNNLLYLLLSLVISVISVSGILSEIALRDLVLRRHYPRWLAVGEATPVQLEVVNGKARSALHLELGEVVDDPELQHKPGYVLHLGPGDTATAVAWLRPLRRGPMATAALSLSTAYPFGFARKSRLWDEPARFLALPPVASVQLPWQGAPHRQGALASPQAGQGDQFRGLRDARGGDSLRDMHWKVSARRDRLIAREWEAEASRRAVVRFAHLTPNHDPDPRRLDQACATVAGLCAALLRDGLAVGLQTAQGEVPPEREEQPGPHLLRLRAHLAELVAADLPPPDDWPLADDQWLALARAATERGVQLSQGRAWPWPGSAELAEVFLVQFASRPLPAAGHVDAWVQLDDVGELAGIERARTVGAA
jgi:uncharacterized protein (DUF58 family)